MITWRDWLETERLRRSNHRRTRGRAPTRLSTESIAKGEGCKPNTNGHLPQWLWQPGETGGEQLDGAFRDANAECRLPSRTGRCRAVRRSAGARRRLGLRRRPHGQTHRRVPNKNLSFNSLVQHPVYWVKWVGVRGAGEDRRDVFVPTAGFGREDMGATFRSSRWDPGPSSKC